jgi:hypothetical protein
MSYDTLIRHTLYINRNNPLFGFDLNYADARSRQLLTNGLESRRGRIESSIEHPLVPRHQLWGFFISCKSGDTQVGGQLFWEQELSC